MLHSFSPPLAKFLPSGPKALELPALDASASVDLCSPASLANGSPMGRKYVDFLLGRVEYVAINGWKHGIDDLFEVIAEVGLPLSAVGPNAILAKFRVTLITSISKLTRSRSGSSANAFRSSY